jgi:phage gp29-like protein
MKTPTLVDQYGRPVQRARLTEEKAGPTLGGVRSVLTGYPGNGLTPGRLASILRDADQGDALRYLELAETIEERDMHYAGVLGTRKRSVAQLEIQVDAASDDAEHVQHADMIREWLLRDELQGELFDMLDAVGKGYSVTEIIWDTSEGSWQPKRLEYRDPRFFALDRADGTTPLLRTDQGDVPLDPFCFISTVIRAKSGLPIRSGIARLAVWFWMFKSFTARDWAIFTQTYGQPIRVGKYGQGASNDDKDVLFRAVANIAGDCAAIIPDSMVIEFIESKSIGSSSDLYERRANWLDQQLSKAVLGQTATTDAIAGGHAVGREHRQVQEDIERADAIALSACLNRDLARPWIDLEFGPQEKYPRIRIGRRDEKDVKLIVEAVTKLVPMGMRVQVSDMRDLLGLADPDREAEVLTAPPRPAQPAIGADPTAVSETAPAVARQLAALFAAEPRREKDAVDVLAEQAERLAAPAGDALIARIRDLVMTAPTLDDVRTGLLALAPNMPTGDLGGLMRQALVMAELSGRDEIGSLDG